MLLPGSTSVVLAMVAFAFGGVVAWVVLARFWPRSGPRRERLAVQAVVERVRAVGKLVGLEVCAKEIATATSGWAWLPPLLLSQARLAMIFNFEKQYTVDLSRVEPEDVQELGPGRFRLMLPPMQGHLRLIDITPYDIQSAKVLGLLDLVAMTAERQKDLMRKAQQQAASLYEQNDERYLAQARLSVERHLRSLLELFGVEVDVRWLNGVQGEPVPFPRPTMAPFTREVVPQLPAAVGAA